VTKRYALTDEHWDRIKDLLPEQAGQPKATGRDNRPFVNAALYRYRAGIPWRHLPERSCDFRVAQTVIRAEAGEACGNGFLRFWRWMRTTNTPRLTAPSFEPSCTALV
jgi:transposase